MLYQLWAYEPVGLAANLMAYKSLEEMYFFFKHIYYILILENWENLELNYQKLGLFLLIKK